MEFFKIGKRDVTFIREMRVEQLKEFNVVITLDTYQFFSLYSMFVFYCPVFLFLFSMISLIPGFHDLVGVGFAPYSKKLAVSKWAPKM